MRGSQLLHRTAQVQNIASTVEGSSGQQGVDYLLRTVPGTQEVFHRYF